MGTSTNCVTPKKVTACAKTMWNRASMLRKALPKHPEDFAKVISHVVKKTTPRKKRAVLLELEKRRKIIRANLQRYDQDRAEVTKTKVSKRDLFFLKKTIEREKKKRQRKARKGLETSVVKKVHVFFMRISKPMPQKRFATRHGPGYSLQMTLTQSFKLFKGENPNITIGFTKFRALKPKCVRLLSKSQWNVCVCSICFNIKYKLSCLNRNQRLLKPDTKTPNDEMDLYSFLLCEKPDSMRFHSAACARSTCPRCSNYSVTIQNMYSDLVEKNPVLTWNHWERVTGKDGKERKSIAVKTGMAIEAVKEFVDDVQKPVQWTTFVSHLFTANWQQYQFNSIRNNLGCNQVLMVMDFGKNRLLRYQDEAKSAYFAIEQVTIHPIILFYKCAEIPDLTVRHSLVFLSNDLKHDYHDVRSFMSESIDFMESQNIPHEEIIFSDGSSSQYKNSSTLVEQIGCHPETLFCQRTWEERV